MSWRRRVADISDVLARGLAPLTDLAGVRDVRTFGAIGVVELDDQVDVAITVEEQKAQNAQPFVPPSREMVLRDPAGNKVCVMHRPPKA